METKFPTTRSEILQKLENFCDTRLQNYSMDRNFDYGPPHLNVSTMSPFLKRRLISEEEILHLGLKKFEISEIEKFIQEIFWKTYWKGWLQFNPFVYTDYSSEKIYDEIPTRTGIKCFDYWTEELVETGYLHNHSRMWYASIWIFTLNKTWQSGANFFKYNLLDWCPASNTLSWRWVAGLQTVGKHYVAKADNINFFTNNRFHPTNQLNESPLALERDASTSDKLCFAHKTQNLKNLDAIGLVLNDNDLSLNLLLTDLKVPFEGCIYKDNEVNLSKSNLVIKFENKLFHNLLNQHSCFDFIQSYSSLIKWAKRKKIKNLVFPYETVGNNILCNEYLLQRLKEENINYLFYQRDWDRYAFPFTNKGFFPFKKKIPELLTLNQISSSKSS